MSGRLTDEDGSSPKLTSDESPRLDVDGQATRFNSQFYSLCKVDSNRSLQSSVNNSREKLSLTSLNESCEEDGIDCAGKGNCKNHRDGDSKCCPFHGGGDSEIAAKEFDEISRQIANLSRTVDELNHSLSSLTSSEFEPDTPCAGAKRAFSRLDGDGLLHSATTTSLASSLPKLVGRKNNDIIDGYHWVNDEFFLISGSGDIIVGGRKDNNNDDDDDDHINSSSDALACLQDRNSSFEQNDTEDAREEFLHISTISSKSSVELSSSDRRTSGNWTLSKTGTGGQDDIFARSIFDTVRENNSSSHGNVKNGNENRGEAGDRQRSTSEGKVAVGTDASPTAKSLSVPAFDVSGNDNLEAIVHGNRQFDVDVSFIIILNL